VVRTSRVIADTTAMRTIRPALLLRNKIIISLIQADFPALVRNRTFHPEMPNDKNVGHRDTGR
jgi:hypothetical protein